METTGDGEKEKKEEKEEKEEVEEEEEKVSRAREGILGQAGVYQQHEPTHGSQSKTYGNPSPPRGCLGPQARKK